MDLQELKEFRLDVVVRHDGEVLVGQCLQFDIAVQGSNMEEVEERFALSLAGYIAENQAAKEAGLPGWMPPRAPQQHWRMFRTGTVKGRDVPIYVPSTRDQKLPSFRATFAESSQGATAS